MDSLCNVELPTKTSSATSSRLQGFIEDELTRAPLLIEDLVQQYAEVPMRFSADATTQERQVAFNRRDALLRAIPHMAQAFSQSLREQVGSLSKRQAAVRGKSLNDVDPLGLSLVDENDMAVEVALQRTTVMIHSAAEAEMRELGRFTSALVGDVNVACDTNPFKPEAYAQALLAAAQALPRPAAEQMAFIHQVAMPFSQALRKTCAAATARLQAQGIEPASHRTIILPPSAPSARARMPDLDAMSDAMPLPPDMDPVPLPQRSRGAAAPAVPAKPASAVYRVTEQPVPETAPGTGVGAQGIERLGRLFDTILSDAALPQDVQRLLRRLHSLAVREVLRDPAMLKSSGHPAWKFMDRLVFEAGRHDGDPEARERLMRYADGLVAHMTREPVQDAALYVWALGRIEAYARHRLAQLCLDAQPHIDSLRGLVSASAGGAAASGAGAQPGVKPGDWMRLSQQDQWRELLLLWTDERGEAWLFRQPGGRTLALRRMALERLIDADLAQPLEPSSLMQRAAQVLRQASSSKDAQGRLARQA